MAEYQCTSCGHRFVVAKDAQLRCPRCLRQNGLEELSQPDHRTSSDGSVKRLLTTFLGLIALVALFVAAGLLFIERRHHVPAPGELAMLDPQLLRRTLQQRGVPDRDVVDPFVVGEALRKLIGPSIPQTGSAQQRARAVVARLRPRLEDLRLDLTAGGTAPVRTAEMLAQMLSGAHATTALSYELGVLVTAALRHVGLTALLCDVHATRSPAGTRDPTGALGSYAVAVYDDGRISDKPSLVLDPARAAKLPRWAGTSDGAMTSAVEDFTPLDDASAAARSFSLRALYELNRHPTEPERAYELAQLAQDASATSATLHTARALVLAQAGSLRDAVEEARKAVRLRSDPPRRTTLARLLLAEGRVDEAQHELDQAIKQREQFWPAQRALASVLWMRGDTKAGNVAMKRAYQLAPEEPSVIALVAAHKLAEGDTAGALELLRALAKRAPSEPILLQLYMVLRRAKKDSEAEAVRKRLLATSTDKQRIQEALQRLDEALAATETQPPGETTPNQRAADSASEPGLPDDQKWRLPDVSLTP